MVINILLCDDDKAFNAQMERRLYEQMELQEIRLNITTCCSPDQLEDADLASFQLAFLDIDMGSCNGMEVARRIRSLGLDILLIFVTRYVEYSLEGYEVNAFRYLLKDEVDTKLPIYFSQALHQIQARERYFTYASGGFEYTLKLDNILYLENRLRTIYIHTLTPVQGPTVFYATMDKVEAELAPTGFLRIQRSYLVNMQHIRTLHYDAALLCDGTSLPVSRQGFQKIKLRYMKWRAQCS